MVTGLVAEAAAESHVAHDVAAIIRESGLLVLSPGPSAAI